MTLDRFFAEHRRAALAFSGGCDSAYLLYAAVSSGAEVKPYFVKSAFQPEFELRDARRLAAELKIELCVIECDILACEAVADNPPDRCYHCKKAIFTAIAERAAADGFELLLDGSNASDDAGDRPGMRALRELCVRSPLREAGLTKAEIRRLSREAGLFTADKPAYACLATRVPTGERLDEELLRRVELAEGEVAALGFTDFRVRVFSGAARLQLCAEQLPRAIELRQSLCERIGPYFEPVLLDLKER